MKSVSLDYMTERSLMDLFDDMDIDGMKDTLEKLAMFEDHFPLDDVLELLEATSDLELTVYIVELLMLHITRIDEALMLTHYPKSSDKVKQQIITVLSTFSDSKYMQFLLDEYFNNPYFRPAIRSQAFKDKTHLFMNLVRFYEGIPLSSNNVVVAQQLLRMIPRQVVVSTAHLFAGTKLMDVYYALPPSDREQ